MLSSFSINWDKAAQTFSGRVTPDEFKGAGLEKLSPEALAQVNALFQKYRHFAGGVMVAAQLEIHAAANCAEAA